MTKKLVIATILLLGALPVMPQRNLISSTNGWPAGGNEDVSRRQFDIGSKLGRSLVEGCSIFFGTVRKVGQPVKEDKYAVSHAEVLVAVDEWLWDKRIDLGPVIQLDQTSVPEKRRYSSEGRSAWDGVEVRVGSQLLVALRKNPTELEKYGLIVSDVTLFPAIHNALTWHGYYLQNPNALLSAAEVVNGSSDSIFPVYLISYLWRGGSFGNRDNEALTLGRLLARSDLGESSSALIKLTLPRFMLSDSNPLSEATRRSLIEILVVVGGGENLKPAADAISVLVRLSDNQQLEMTPYLTPERTRKLSENYRALIQTGKIDKRQTAFESQLNARKP